MSAATDLLAKHAVRILTAAIDVSGTLGVPLHDLTALLCDDAEAGIARGVLRADESNIILGTGFAVLGLAGSTAQRAGQLLDGAPLDFTPSRVRGVLDVVVIAAGDVFVSGVTLRPVRPRLTLVRGGRT